MFADYSGVCATPSRRQLNSEAANPQVVYVLCCCAVAYTDTIHKVTPKMGVVDPVVIPTRERSLLVYWARCCPNNKIHLNARLFN